MLQRTIDDQAKKLSEYSDVLRAIAVQLEIDGVAPVGLVEPSLARKKIMAALQSQAPIDEQPAVPGAEERPITSTVRRIGISSSMEVVIEQGDEPRLVLECDNKALLKKVITQIDGDTLTLDTEPMMIISSRKSSKGCQVTQNFHGSVGGVVGGSIYIGNGNMVNSGVGAIQIGGGGGAQQVFHTGSVPTFKVKLTLPRVAYLFVTGSASVVYGNCQQSAMSIRITGSGSIDIAGTAEKIDVKVSGSGSVDARRLNVKEGIFNISGSVEVEATVTDSVTANISGVGRIKIAGNPSQRDTNVSGVGKIKFVSENHQ